MTHAYIGIGSNQDNPALQIKKAVNALKAIPNTQYMICSSLYRTPPYGGVEQDDFINAVALLSTELKPLALLDELQGIEQQQGRQRTVRWGPRRIDLDILLFGEHYINNERLTIPHPGLTQRSFVLFPLVEIAPSLVLPNGELLTSLLTTCENNLTRLPTTVA